MRTQHVTTLPEFETVPVLVASLGMELTAVTLMSAVTLIEMTAMKLQSVATCKVPSNAPALMHSMETERIATKNKLAILSLVHLIHNV